MSKRRKVPKNIIKIELTRADCDALLQELRHALSIINRNNYNAAVLYEKIASIYFGEETKIHPEAMRNKFLGISETPSKPEPPPLRAIKESEDKPRDDNGDCEPEKTFLQKLKWW